MNAKLLRLKYQIERRIQHSNQMSNWSRGYIAAYKQVIKDIDKLLQPPVMEDNNHAVEGSRFDRPMYGFADDCEGTAETIELGTAWDG